MAQMKELMLAVQEQLSAVSGLKHVDKDWGQLRYEQQPVKYPCALIDLEQVGFSQLGKGYQLADVSITVTIANQRLVPTSSKAPGKHDGYSTIELIEATHYALQLYYKQGFAPLVRTNLRKVYIDNTFEVYAITYQTQFTVDAPDDGSKNRPTGVKVRINPVVDGIEFRDVEGTLGVE